LAVHDLKTLIAALPRKTHDHGGQAHCQRKASGQLEVGVKQQDKSRNEQFPSSNPSQRGDDPHTDSRYDASEG
jgi:hypothetical protein